MNTVGDIRLNSLTCVGIKTPFQLLSWTFLFLVTFPSRIKPKAKMALVFHFNLHGRKGWIEVVKAA